MHELFTLWIDGSSAGPYTLGQLKAMWSGGAINANTLYCIEGSDDWKPILEIAGELEGTKISQSHIKNIYQKKSSKDPVGLHGWKGTITLLLIVLFVVGSLAGILTYYIDQGDAKSYYRFTSVAGLIEKDDLDLVGAGYHKGRAHLTEYFYELNDTELKNKKDQLTVYINGNWSRDGDRITVIYDAKPGYVSTQTLVRKGEDLFLVESDGKDINDASRLYTEYHGWQNIKFNLTPLELFKGYIGKIPPNSRVSMRDNQYIPDANKNNFIVEKYDNVSYDVEKSDSLVSPYTSTFKFRYQSYVEPRGQYAGDIDRDYDVKLAFQDSKWVVKEVFVRLNDSDGFARNSDSSLGSDIYLPKSYSFSFAPDIDKKYLKDYQILGKVFQ